MRNAMFQNVPIDGCGGWLKYNTYNVIKHPKLGSVFTYADHCMCVGWSPDRRKNFAVRLMDGFSTAREALDWAKEYGHLYEPDEMYFREKELKKNFRRTRSPRDSQKQKVFDWERVMEAMDGKNLVSHLNKKEALDYVQHVYDTIGVPNSERPKIVMSDAKNHVAYYWLAMNKLKFPPWARKRSVILHEIAHHVTDWSHKTGSIAIHGPEFMKVYLELILLFSNSIDKEELLESCRRHRVKYHEPNFTTFDDESELQSTIRRRLSRR